MPENIVNNIWFVAVLNTGTMSHVLRRWEHLKCQVEQVFLKRQESQYRSEAPTTMFEVYLGLRI